jgi:SAM-dependent methyltransferase
LEYHRRELDLALDASHPSHSLPPVPLSATRILDIGCGMGQTLVALQLGPAVEAWGVDCDEEAVAAGREIAEGNIHLAVGAGEHLPFPDASFDLVYSRVALPYMDIGIALAEICRVLRAGGKFWAALHPPQMLIRRMREDIAAWQVRDLIFCGFVALNSVWLRVFRRQLRIRGHCETVQTRAGFEKLLKAAGLEPLPVNTWSDQFIVEAQKPQAARADGS